MPGMKPAAIVVGSVCTVDGKDSLLSSSRAGSISSQGKNGHSQGLL